MFDSPDKLLLGLVTGFLFGFLLQKGQVTKFHTIVGQFLLRDFTVLKTMLTAVVVGSVGVYAMHATGGASLHVKPLILGGVIGGGLLFGLGMALLGYCPGTGIGAVAEGSRHAIFGVLGMLFGAALYVEAFPLLQRSPLAWGNYGKLTLPEATGIPAAAWICLIALGAGLLFAAIELWERRRDASAKVCPAEPGRGTSAAAPGA